MPGNIASVDRTYPKYNIEKHKKMKISRMEATDTLLERFVSFTLSDISKKKKNIRNKITERLLE